MISLSVNLNKIALLRNSRGGPKPSLIWAAKVCLDAGCQGITVHPRPDQRHIRPEDLKDLKKLIQVRADRGESRFELNVEGRPTADFLNLIEEIQPDQTTLVPDSPGALTSDHGWNLEFSQKELEQVIPRLNRSGTRTAIFMDSGVNTLKPLADLGVSRIELFTGPFAEAFGESKQDEECKKLFETAEHALGLGLEINAGHDLTVENLPLIRELPGLKEVSIGHHLIGRALEIGLKQSVLDYRKALGHEINEK